MSVFVKKLVEKASLKKPAGWFSDSLKPDDVNPHLVFHYGIPLGSMLLAYDSFQRILAISTKDGLIKLFSKDGSQTILESPEAVQSKFLLFLENQGVILNVNVSNHIEVWDIEKKCLSAIHHFEKEITSLAAMRNGHYLYVGDSCGDVSVLRLHQEPCHIEPMKYRIPFAASHGKTSEAGSEISVKYILPQPAAEAKRVLIIYSDGVITLWSIRESKAVFSSCSGSNLQSTNQETKKVTAACWACPVGTKVAVGYSNGDIILWGIPDSKTEEALQNESSASQITSICKLNLGYKANKIPIAKLKWVNADGKLSRLYALGCSEGHSSNLLQVVLLNESTESRTIKLGLYPHESVVDMEITTNTIEQSKSRHDSLLLLGKSSHVYTYDDSLIERYLVQSQTKSSPSLPREAMIKLPYGDSSITVTKFITSIPCMPCSTDEDINMLTKNRLPLLPFETSLKDGNSSSFSPFSRAKNLFITGHSCGAINFWDASQPVLLPVASITQQSDNDFSASGIPVTALHFNYDSHLLVSGDQSGMVRIYTLKSESFAPQNTFMPFQGSSKKGNNHIIRGLKVVKVNGAVISINTTENLKQLAIGTDQGFVFLVDPEGLNVLYQKHIASEFSTGIISMHFETCSFHGFEKNVMIVTTKDSSILTLERDTGNTLNSGVVRPNKPSRALFTRILNGMESGTDINNINSDNSAPKQSYLLLCSEKATYTYSLSHLVQGVKKVLYKKKYNLSCYWASTVGCPDAGLILLFTSGRIEIRSLPELSLVKESSLRALTFSNFRPFSVSDITVSSSHDGEIIIVNGDQEVLFVSTLLHNEAYRLLDYVSQVLNKDLVNTQGIISSPSAKEKKKSIFSSMIKDNKSTKPKNGPEMEMEDSIRSIEELSTVFSSVNFPTDAETEEKKVTNEEDIDLDIDDIDIDDPKEKARGYPVIAGLNKQNFTNTFQAIKGKLKHVKVKTEKAPVNDEPQDEKTGAVNQIKKKYGYTSSGDSSAANMAKTKLSENLKKLQLWEHFCHFILLGHIIIIFMGEKYLKFHVGKFEGKRRYRLEVLRFTENEKKGL
ncbi:hypothetical protein CDL12_10104 [Handroanthus impetiginosus]|uniref:Lethal giant larvae (Lgl)-like C-terminal domain-containing protein n=1 Tax=Handroanthus impetiginosus TaxID=429701 RepID=A0A2G9HIA0_9LAMI|nr:hypothetical protein CDL12_10104 [Handroanthus impetiginosus]